MPTMIVFSICILFDFRLYNSAIKKSFIKMESFLSRTVGSGSFIQIFFKLLDYFVVISITIMKNDIKCLETSLLCYGRFYLFIPLFNKKVYFQKTNIVNIFSCLLIDFAFADNKKISNIFVRHLADSCTGCKHAE